MKPWQAEQGPPAAWTQPTFAIQTNTNYLYYECERFAWMEFERPVRLLAEVNTNFVADNNCTTGDHFPASLVQAIYLDDAELASALQERYSLPVQLSALKLEAELTNTPMAVQLEWQVGDNPRSASTFRFEGDLTAGTPDRSSWVWESTTGINTLLLSDDSMFYHPSPMIATTDVSEPMMVANTIADTPMAHAGFRPHTTISATLTEYEDMLCEQPR